MCQTEKTNSLKDLICNARRVLLIDKNPSAAIDMLIELSRNYNLADDKLFKNSLALALFEEKKFGEAANIYLEAGEKYQAGFCELLLGNTNYTKELWYSLPENEVVCWGKSLLGLLDLKFFNLPSFVQIRNHLECDLGYFLQADKLDYVESIVKCSEVLASVNMETYKFIGKAFLYNGFADLSVNYFMKSQKMVPQDAEVYYHLSQYSYSIGAYEEAKLLLRQCIFLNEHYTPARQMLERPELT